MIPIIRHPGGAWERNSDGSRGARLWFNRAGRRTLTAYGAARLANFQDLTIHVPVIERGYATADHPITETRYIWYPVSESSMPGLVAMLQDTVPLAYINRLEDLTTLPPEFKNWILSQLDPDGTGILDEGSDRYWEEDDTRQWYMSVQHVEVGRDGRARLVTDLAGVSAQHPTKQERGDAGLQKR